LASPWSVLLGTFGLPIEAYGPASTRPPLATWALAAAILMVNVVTLIEPNGMSQDLGLIPARPFRLGGLTWITSFFLHGGVLHLLGNLYFLCLFGRAVEDCLGRGRYLLLVALADLVGNVAHVLLDPASDVPCIGASGGISGILAFYALRFPQARLAFLWRPFVVLLQWMVMPAWGAFVLWLLLQALGVVAQLGGMSDVSSLAHLGGATAGLAFWLGELRSAGAGR
jgi:membrane associated rhomboid family serine protease